MALIVARILKPGSKLSTVRALRQETANTSLSLELGLQDVAEKEVYETIDWLQQRQKREDAVRAYKDLAKVERALRSMKTVELKVRPIYHRLDDRTGSHVFLCMLN